MRSGSARYNRVRYGNNVVESALRAEGDAMMRKFVKSLLAVLVFGIMFGCEWETSSDEDSWNDAYSWANFAGIYRPVAGNTYVVSAFAPQPASPATTASATQSIG